MKCPGCQGDLPPDARFCPKCGLSLGVVCQHCNTTNTPGDAFCKSCGQPLAPASSASQRFGAPDTYTPKHLAERILLSKEALEGERKQVTVLFADLKGSMELLADRDPEEARKLLDPVLERMMEAVHRYEGTVNQVMGDGIMALFGAPLALRTTRCARATRRWPCSRPSTLTASRRSARTVWRSGYGLDSIRARLSYVRSAAIYTWITPPWGRPRIWPPAWSSWQRPAAPC